MIHRYVSGEVALQASSVKKVNTSSQISLYEVIIDQTQCYMQWTVHQLFCILHFLSRLFPLAVWSWQYSSLRGVRLKCYYAFVLVCCGSDTSYIGSVHIQCQASIYTLSLCLGHSMRVRLANQEMHTPPGHLASPLVCRGP